MTRPQIIRADTIDLQDKTSPTAQDHSTQPTHPAPYGIGPAAPHQQAAIRHAEEERQAEEARLLKAWSVSASTLRDDPDSDDDDDAATMVDGIGGQSSLQHDEQAVRLNGSTSMNGGEAARLNGSTSMGSNDADLHEADQEDDLDDDDLMDKISSSPSIDDGGCSLHYNSPIWPIRRDSLTPLSSPLQASSTSSSPFITTPPHFPVSAVDARRPLRVPARGDFFPHPISFQSSFQLSTEHHLGECARTWRANGPSHDVEIEEQVSTSPGPPHVDMAERGLQAASRIPIGCFVPNLEEQPTTLPRILPTPYRAEDDPFVDPTPSPSTVRPALSKVEHPEDDGDSWTTDSDADSWAEDLEHNDDDASNDISFSDDPRFIDSGWGGECLRETEDIDFEFVYALHTFVATVEGQANATKGDTMVLLDDSNSYWWLVRIVKDSSIGYLPAEHIETPTERLARLNKHRNVDLSATMLGDTAEKSKNPLKKAMRRRNAKTVQFGAPTYVEASDYDYSSDEGDGELFGGPEPKQMQLQQEDQDQQQAATKVEAGNEDGIKVQPTQSNGSSNDRKSQLDLEGDPPSESGQREDEKQDLGDEALDRPADHKISRNGTLRNTDSFFKDENTETRKITLTPNLLRDDSGPSIVLRERGPSLESLEKNVFADKGKEKKEKKEKKGMLSGLFKRKDKKGKGSHDAQDSDWEKSEEVGRSRARLNSEESTERMSIEQVQASAPVGSLSKGKSQQTQQVREDSPQKTKGILKNDSPTEPTTQLRSKPDMANGTPTGPQVATMRVVSPEQEGLKESVNELRLMEKTQAASNGLGSNNPFGKLMDTQQESLGVEETKTSTQHTQLDDFDSDESSDPFADPDAQRKLVGLEKSSPGGRLSESPVQVSAMDGQPSNKSDDQETHLDPDLRHPPGLSTDDSSQETSSPVSTPTPDGSQSSIAEQPNGSPLHNARTPSPATRASDSNAALPPVRPAPVPAKHETEHIMSPPISSDTAVLPAWSDSSLRAYLDDGSDIRDMLLVVNDTTGVIPVGKDHPLMKGLFVEESKAVQGLRGELDTLLNGLLNKRIKRSESNAGRKISSPVKIGRSASRNRPSIR